MAERAEHGRRRFAIATATTLIGVALLGGLGTWQVQRGAWKDGLQAALDARLALAPSRLPPRLDDPAAWRHRRAVVTGRFDHGHEMTVLAPARDGASGYHVVTPLIRADGSAVLVDRGWVPLALRDPAARADGQVAGEVAIEGIVTMGREPGPFTPDNDPVAGAWFWADPTAMARAAGVDAPPVLLETVAGSVPGGWPQGGQTVIALRNEHRAYAATWYALAGALAVVYVLFLRRERRGDPP